MDAAKQESTNAVVAEMSKDTKYMKRALANDKRTQARIEEIKRLRDIHENTEMRHIVKEVDEMVHNMEINTDKTQVWMVVDFDQFFAAVAMRDNPSLVGKPVAVGGMSMISTANYEARKYGVRSAMPGFIGIKLCPQLIFVDHDSEAYRKASNVAREILELYDPQLSSISLDEFYLNLTNYFRNVIPLFPGLTDGNIDKVSEVINEIRQKIFAAVHLTVSAGVGYSSLIAKIAAGTKKPNGQYVVSINNSVSFLQSLPIRQIPGVGKVSESIFQKGFGIYTIKQLYDKRYILHKIMSKHSRSYIAVSLACTDTKNAFAFFSSSEDDDGIGRKSVSRERTFQSLSDPKEQYEMLHHICEMLWKDIKEKNLYGRTVTVKMKTVDFVIKDRSCTLRNLVGNDFSQLYETAQELFRSAIPISLRLLGVRLSGLENPPKYDTQKQSKYVASASSSIVSSSSAEFDKQNPQASSSKSSQHQLLIKRFLKPTAKQSEAKELPFLPVISIPDTHSDDDLSHLLNPCPHCNGYISFTTIDELNHHLSICSELAKNKSTSSSNNKIVTIDEDSPESQRISTSSSGNERNLAIDKYFMKTKQ